MLRNTLNLLPEVARGTPIERRARRGDLPGASGQVTANAPTEALHAGIFLVVCRNSMTSQNMNDQDLIPGTVTVACAVGHLVARQGQGWAYLRP